MKFSKHALFRNALVVVAMILLGNWLLIVATVRIEDVTPSDKLGLLSLLPPHFIVALVSIPVFAFLAIYLRRYRLSILLITLFLMYMRLTPFIIEPLRGIDTLYHFSRVVVINDLGHLPPTQKYYFDFPGSSIFTSSLLSVTGLNHLFFLNYLFPTLTLFVQYSGILILLRKTFKDSRYITVGLLLSSFFPLGEAMFSPAAMASMFFPLLVYLFLYSQKHSHFLVFFVLSFAITVTNPTATVFLLFIFLSFVSLLKARFRHSKFEKYFRYKALVFGVIFFSWVAFQSYNNVLFQMVVNSRAFLDTILMGQSEIATRLSPPMASIYETSVARRLYFGIGVFLSVLILIKAAILQFRNHEKIRRNPRPLFGPTITFVGLALSLMFFIALSQHPFGEVAAAYAFFGLSFGVGFLVSFSSKLRVSILCALIVFLTIPMFISYYPYEQYFIVKDPSFNGLKFIGKHINHSKAGIVCPFGLQLWAFTKLDLWDHIYLDIPIFSSSVKPPPNPDYYISRIEGLYYDEIRFGTELHHERYVEMLSSYNQIYSSGTFEILGSTK